MRKFISREPHLKVSHQSLKDAAGSEQYVLTFDGDIFLTENDALADALAALPLPVEEVKEAPPEPAPEVEKAVKRGPNRK